MAKKIIIDETYLSPEELKILYKVTNDPFYFSSFIKVIHPTKGKVSFNLYPFQFSVLYQFLTHQFNIILKFRQAGITELISMYCLWLAMYHPNKKINIISIKDVVAKKVLKKIKFMYKNLPWYLQTPIVNGRPGEYGSASFIEFSNGSFIESIPTSEQAGRSEGLSLLVIDEAAVVKWASVIWASSFPTLSTGGSAIVNSCVTGDTEIIGRNGNFKIEQVCPKEFGVQDIRFMGLEVLTHKLQWKKAIYGLNKGILETWEISDNNGNIIKCTPAHKFLTPKGWMSVKDIIDKNLYAIQFDTGITKIEEPPITELPKDEIFREIKGFKNYLISNHGRVVYKKNLKEKPSRPNKFGYYRIKLWANGKNKTFTVAKLVAETFIGKIPSGYVVDHIDCNPAANHLNNLQIITTKENAQRAVRFSRNLVLNNNTGKGATDIQLVGYIKYLHLLGKDPIDIICKVKRRFDKTINKSYISRIISGKINKGITISRLKVTKKYSDTIYDITIENDESYISNSTYVSHNTPYGVGNFYHSTWVDAVMGENPLNPIRLHWQMHPERDEEWYKTMASALGPKRTAQEIDGDFLSSGNTVFDLSDIKAIEDTLPDYQPIKKRMNGKLLIFDEPKDRRYILGADCSTGRSDDYSAFTLGDEFGEEAAVFKGRIPLNKYTRLIGDIGETYNYALLAPETNDIGLTVTTALQDEGYPNLYYSKKLLKKKRTAYPEEELIPGWLTTSKNRSLIIEGLEKDIREEEITVKDPFFVNEAYTFIYDSTGRPIAMGKRRQTNSSVDLDLEGQTYSDDSIFGKAIYNQVRKTEKPNITTPPV